MTRRIGRRPYYPLMIAPCALTPTDVLSVAASGYDPDHVHVALSERNEAGYQTGYMSVWLTPEQAMALAQRLYWEAQDKANGGSR